jgi:hypothetical protein
MCHGSARPERLGAFHVAERRGTLSVDGVPSLPAGAVCFRHRWLVVLRPASSQFVADAVGNGVEIQRDRPFCTAMADDHSTSIRTGGTCGTTISCATRPLKNLWRMISSCVIHGENRHVENVPRGFQQAATCVETFVFARAMSLCSFAPKVPRQDSPGHGERVRSTPWVRHPR